MLVLTAYIFLSLLPRGRVAKIPLAETEIANLKAALDEYHVQFGEYPGSENARILKALLGENPKKIKLFDANPKRLNSRGEFLDPWKTPYEIQIIGNTNFAIRSSGADRVFGNQDDITNSVQ